MERSSGILLHVTSLPGPHGIGDLGPAAYRWVDLLAAARQTWWQILPLGPTGYADSPYQCFSAFAGNPNLISLEALVDDRLLTAGDLPRNEWPENEVDYDRVRPVKNEATSVAYQRFLAGDDQTLTAELNHFRRQEAAWLGDFALFAALKDEHPETAWWEWPAEHRIYDRQRASELARHFADAVGLHEFRQFLFFRQWRKLREHAHHRRVRIIGDMPIFIASDSADMWSHPELFLVDENRRPSFVAGVPPDYFSATGQLWGNPLYDWAEHRRTGYQWWISRLASTLKLVDKVRLDHFRGFEAYWAVPAGDKTAERGTWEPGPGGELFNAVKAALGELPLIAEDLGVITPEVDALRRAFGLPGMRILQFAFGGAIEDRFVPHNYVHHTVVYTGTHDNETTVGWYENLKPEERTTLLRYAPWAEDDPAGAMIRLAWASVADMAIVPLQDILRLGNEARMNCPGCTDGNWRWRVSPRLLKADLLDDLADITEIYQRGPATRTQRASEGAQSQSSSMTS
jgi:4-alpha-glucanotransferase